MNKIFEATKIGAMIVSLILVVSVMQAAFVSAQTFGPIEERELTGPAIETITEQQTGTTELNYIKIAVADAETGELIENSKISIYDEDGESVKNEDSNSGVFVISLPLGEYVVVASASGYETSEKKSFEIEPGYNGVLEVELAKSITIPKESQLTVKAFDTSDGDIVDGTKAIVIRNVLIPRATPYSQVLVEEPVAAPEVSGGGQGAPSTIAGGSEDYTTRQTIDDVAVIATGTDSGYLSITVYGVRQPTATNAPSLTAVSNTRYALEGATVTVYDEDGNLIGKGKTNENGAVRFGPLEEDAYIVTAVKDGFIGQKELLKAGNSLTTQRVFTLYPNNVRPPTISKEIVVGVIEADGKDSIDLRAGVYQIIVFAKDYSLFKHTLKVDGIRDKIEIKAPLTKGGYLVREDIPFEYTTFPLTEEEAGTTESIPEIPTVTIVKRVNGGEVIEISTDVVAEDVETTFEKKPVSIKPYAADTRKLEIRSGDAVAITDSKLEINKEKLFAVAGDTKTQVKVLPKEAYEIARKGTGEIDEIELKVTDKPLYITTKLQNANLFGFIPVQYEEKITIDASDGTETRVSPFWSPLAVPY